MRWTWDLEKDIENWRKHNVRFETARLVFLDPFMFMQEDIFPDEQRWRTLGRIEGEIFLVVHTWPDCIPDSIEEMGRIITARKATPHERRIYYEG